MLLYLYLLYFVLSSRSHILTLMYSTQMSLSGTFNCSVWDYMCNFSEIYPGRSHISVWREEWKSLQLGGAVLFWTGFSKICLVWDHFLLFCCFSPPLLCSQFSDNLQTYGSEKNCSHSSSSCCHLLAGFSKLHNHVTDYQWNASHLGLFCVFGFR